MAFSALASVSNPHSNSTSCVRIAPDGELFATAGADGGLKVWHTSCNSPATVDIRAHTLGVNDVAWSNDGRYIATASDDTTVCMWDAGTGKASQEPFRGHASFAYSVAFNPVNNVIASGSYDEFIRVWDPRTGTCISPIPAHSEPVTSVQWSSDGRQLVSGSYDGLIRIWDAGTGHCLKTLHEQDLPPVSSVCWSPNGQYVLACSLDSTIRLWDVSTGIRAKTYVGHTNERLCLRATFLDGADGSQMIACGSENGDILLWDVSTAEIRQRLSHSAGERSTAGASALSESRQGSRQGAATSAGGSASKRQKVGDGSSLPASDESAPSSSSASMAVSDRCPVIAVDAHPRLDFLISASAGHVSLDKAAPSASAGASSSTGAGAGAGAGASAGEKRTSRIISSSATSNANGRLNFGSIVLWGDNRTGSGSLQAFEKAYPAR